ncbi:MAG: sialate O-acetylesterase [Phycisphaerae bacterium]|jgi:sialate O-acetylesterase|nr:sialate O-acetylesterase [Phycisphaerae bacterium]
MKRTVSVWRRIGELGLCACLLGIVPPASHAAAELRIANIFNNNMVLQRDKVIRVWGWAESGTETSVSLAKTTLTSKADKNGLWQVEFKPLAASFEPRRLVVKSGDKTIELKNILVGEVWLCGGQSNMEGKGHHNQDLELPSADTPAVRYTRLERRPKSEPLADLPLRENWASLGPKNTELNRVAAVPYYFGVRLSRYLKVPVGLINSAVGGTTAEVWASPKSLRSDPKLKDVCKHLGKDTGAFFNGVISPISKFTIRGVLFYQGENNVFEGYETYAHSLPKVISSWREAFGDKALPFGMISLAGNWAQTMQPDPEGELGNGHNFATIRDVHFRTFRATKDTGLITIFDLGEDYMHPGFKRDVGERAARWALANAYDKPVYHTAPIYREMKIDGARALLYFDTDPTVTDKRAGKSYKRLPLPLRARAFKGFIIAGKDHRFFPARAKVRSVKSDADVKKECLEVWSDFVSEPAAVRYAWANQPDANAYGLKGIPVAPFRTDDWVMIRAVPKWAPDLADRQKHNKELRRKLDQWRRERKIMEAKKTLKDLDAK